MLCPTCHHENRAGSHSCEECLTMFDESPEELLTLERTSLADPVDIVARDGSPRIDEGASLKLAVDRMAQASTGCVLVTDPTGQLVGILSERDILNKVVGRSLDLDDEPVWRYMTHAPDTVAGDAPLTRALQHMLIGGYRHLPLVDEDGRPTGIVSSRDIVDHVADQL